MTNWNTAVGDTSISNTSRKLLTVGIIPSFGAREPSITDENSYTTSAHLHFRRRTR